MRNEKSFDYEFWCGRELDYLANLSTSDMDDYRRGRADGYSFVLDVVRAF